ncbi:hypothetical protein K431DRAFT_109337 [Polychaeton citri CBS 116435]|uniref:Uncharacterized protein n=1 Tax=Polychaeton citri CBS 116435 TaxID=1314669 RepID=A0A9P4UP49_9PEZI|nr:hypothetical protein K431DRAFT_109337 [Polychaeton citri CBS 116435]
MRTVINGPFPPIPPHGEDGCGQGKTSQPIFIDGFSSFAISPPLSHFLLLCSDLLVFHVSRCTAVTPCAPPSSSSLQAKHCRRLYKRGVYHLSLPSLPYRTVQHHRCVSQAIPSSPISSDEENPALTVSSYPSKGYAEFGGTALLPWALHPLLTRQSSNLHLLDFIRHCAQWTDSSEGGSEREGVKCVSRPWAASLIAACP